MPPRKPPPTADEKEAILALMRGGMPGRAAAVRAGPGLRAVGRELNADPAFRQAWRAISGTVIDASRQAEFLRLLDEVRGTQEACRIMGVSYPATRAKAKRDPAFRREWHARRPPPRPPTQEALAKIIQLLESGWLVVEATREAGVSLHAAYQAHRTDPDFRRAWRRALGQRPAFTESLQLDFLTLLRAGLTRPEAARALNVSSRVEYCLRQRNPEWAARCREAIESRYVGPGTTPTDAHESSPREPGTDAADTATKPTVGAAHSRGPRVTKGAGGEAEGEAG